MERRESERTEFKASVTEDIRKEIIAFANGNGGQLYVGISDDGNIVGVDNPDETALQISNMVRDSIKPDVTMFVHYETREEAGKKYICVDIQRGTDRPYYLARKGIRPEGVYVRQGYSSVPATDAAIRRMIKDTDGDRFEAMRSLEQELTFDAASREFRERNVEFESTQLRMLKLIDRDGLYSNLAFLLSDQCSHTIKVAAFQGNDSLIFKDRREFTGSLLEQMNEVYDFIDFRNQTRATIEGLYRRDVRDYPEVAVREALMNLLMHREYSFAASALISIYADRMEMVSMGGLVAGVELEDVKAGISVCRNQNLSNVFYRLHLVEAYGTGLGKMMKAYEGTGETPILETTANTFKVILPNINAKYGRGCEYTESMDGHSENRRNRENKEKNKGNKGNDGHEGKEEGIRSDANKWMMRVDEWPSYLSEDGVTYSASEEDTLSDEEEQVMGYAAEHRFFTKNDVVTLLDTSPSTASRILRNLVEKKYLVRQGKARNTKYSCR